MLELPSDAAKTAVDARYTRDLETCFFDVTGSRVRLQTSVHDTAPRADVAHTPTARFETSAITASPFVEHEANSLAFRAVERFASDARPFSLLFVHGGAGTGKTALGRHALRLLRQNGSVSRPVVLSGEALTEDVGRAARENKFDQLHDNWRDADVVIFDEVHRVRARKRVQREALTMLVRVLDHGGRALVLSRHPAHDIHVLDRRLQSYLDCGMTAELGAPSHEDREKVLAAVAASLSTNIDARIVPALAAHCAGTLTDAVKVLDRAAGKAAREGIALPYAAVERYLSRPDAGLASVDALLDVVSDMFDVPIARLRSSEKSRPVVAARHLCIYIAAHSLGLSSREVARHMRQQSPSVVAYARRRVNQRRADDPSFDRLVLDLQARIEGAQRDLDW